MTTKILVDFSALTWQARYSDKNVLPEDLPFVVAEKTLYYIKKIGNKFQTNNIIICCDSVSNLRKKIYPQYKEKRIKSRKEKSKLDKELDKTLYKFKSKLKEDMHNIGFNNIFEQDGYEADDIMSAIIESDCLTHFVIVSNDEDMFQCIRGNVDMFAPAKNKLYTYHNFIDEFNYEPQNWWKIKALAGCTSDNIIGIKGITDKNGAKKAVSFFNKTMNKDTKTYKKLASKETYDLYKSNIPLVKLPYEGCVTPVIVNNKFNKNKFFEICNKYELPYTRGEFFEDWKRFFLGYTKSYKKYNIPKKRKIETHRNIN